MLQDVGWREEPPTCIDLKFHAGPSRIQSLRIAFMGTRGVPASYSGFETFVEQLGARLAERGHDVTVYSRRHHSSETKRSYRGMKLVHVGGIATKHLDTISHTFVSCLHSLFRPYDVVVMCISGNSPLAFIPRLRGAKVILNVDGSDWRRKKWGKIARTYIKVSEWFSIRLPNATVTDSKVMQKILPRAVWFGNRMYLLWRRYASPGEDGHAEGT